MRTGHLIAIALTIATSACTPSPPVGELQPQDFARGVPVDVPAGAPFVAIPLPADVFIGAAWPDLRDLRVFNAAGESVPFSRTAPGARQIPSESIALQSFRLESAPVSGTPRVDIDASGSAVQLHVSPGAAASAGAEYLLASRTEDAEKALASLHLEWRAHTENWQQRVSVDVSDDLEQWRSVAVDRPIVDLETDARERLSQHEVVLDRNARQARFWRLRFAPGFAPRLTNVTGSTRSTTEPVEPVPIPTSVIPQTDGSAWYRLPAPMAPARATIVPAAPNSVLPLIVESRASAAEPWQKVSPTVAYRLASDLGEEFSDPVPLNGAVVSELRLRPVGTGWGATPPEVRVDMAPVVVVANARGTGPFLLAWGSRYATDTSLPLTSLVPRQEADGALAYPEVAANVSRIVELGGPSRLTDVAPSERAARWQKQLVWVALVGSTAALFFLARRVWLDVKAGTPSPDEPR